MSRKKSKTPKKDPQTSRIKDKYRIRNWKECNQSLVNRGSITFWFSDDAIEKWYPSRGPTTPAGQKLTQMMQYDEA